MLETAFQYIFHDIIGPAFDYYLLHILPQTFNVNDPPPILSIARDGVRAGALPIDSDTAWSILEKAQQCHTIT